MKILNYKLVFLLFFALSNVKIKPISWGDVTSGAGSVLNRGADLARQGAQAAREAARQGIEAAREAARQSAEVARRGAESARQAAQSAGSTISSGAQTAGQTVASGAQAAYEKTKSTATDAAMAVKSGAETVYTKGEQIYDAVRSIVNDIKDSISQIKDTVSKAANIKTDVIDSSSSLPTQATEVTRKPIETMVETANKLPEDYNKSANLVNQKDLSGIAQMLKTTQNMLTTMLDSTDELFTNVLDKVKWQKPIIGLSNVILSLNESFMILITVVRDITVKLVGKVFGQESSVADAQSVLDNILNVTRDISKISENIIKIMRSSENKS